MTKSQFDREEVIDKALKLFWKNGFSASSMQQVVKTTGLKPGSIYLAFGNKEGLFREALETYAQKSIAYIQSLLDTAPSIGEGICALFEAFIEDSTKKNYNSCFLIKTRLELTEESAELLDFVTAKLEEVEALFMRYLEKEYDENTSQQRAASIMLHIFGVRVYGYQKESADRMRLELREGLSWLPWPTLLS